MEEFNWIYHLILYFFWINIKKLNFSQKVNNLNIIPNSKHIKNNPFSISHTQNPPKTKWIFKSHNSMMTKNFKKKFFFLLSIWFERLLPYGDIVLNMYKISYKFYCIFLVIFLYFILQLFLTIHTSAYILHTSANAPYFQVVLLTQQVLLTEAKK